uniref:Transmembrane protein n=1 Tax=Marseillevirus LCMAC102 TaxID=2506603 RepID=A0A481YUB8_9VIRU|nr:MAG: transmembrane protein [Marseillevirus LCMAC102]
MKTGEIIAIVIAVIVALISIAILIFVLIHKISKPKPPKYECLDSKDCGSGKICRKGICVACKHDSDCLTGYICKDGRCIPGGVRNLKAEWTP